MSVDEASEVKSMPIPNADLAFIPAEKITEYLLNLGHPAGFGKARWFMSLGYSLDEPRLLEADLLRIVRGSSDFTHEATRFGVKYIVVGRLDTPSLRVAELCTVWLIENESPAPRFITAYPHKSPSHE